MFNAMHLLPPVDLRIESDPAGATATVFRNGVPESCTTPCVIKVRRADSFRMAVTLSGYRVVELPPIDWKARLGHGYVLEPNPYKVSLAPVAAAETAPSGSQ